MCNGSLDNCCCCCYGPQGPQGVSGNQGIQGIQGPAGTNGVDGAVGPRGLIGPTGSNGNTGQNGAAGPQGPQGPQGIKGDQGPQGIQGVPGKDCDKNCCCERFINLYSSVSQVIQPYASIGSEVLFNSNNSMSVGDFDISNANINGSVLILKHGIYEVLWQLQGRIQPPIPEPVPSFSFGIFLNDVLVSGSIYSAFTQSPNDSVVVCGSSVFLELKADRKSVV